MEDGSEPKKRKIKRTPKWKKKSFKKPIKYFGNSKKTKKVIYPKPKYPKSKEENSISGNDNNNCFFMTQI